jgi:flagellar basal-body rod protein FlgF
LTLRLTQKVVREAGAAQRLSSDGQSGLYRHDRRQTYCARPGHTRQQYGQRQHHRLPTRAYALTENPSTNLSQGTLEQTGRDLDVAINGSGWIAVQNPSGGEAYTRAGSLRVSALGQLQTADGRLVLGDSGPITLPPFEKMQIGEDGTITVREQGQAPNGLSQVARIKLVKPYNAQLQKGEDGLMHMRNGEKPPAADPTVMLQTGFLQNSNVNIVDEFTSIVALARQFDMNMKLMRTTEDNSASATKLLQLS